MPTPKNDIHRIYLDHSATTPVGDEVFEAMVPYLRRQFGNPGSIHRFGREARRAVDDARDRVAALINADPREIVFTSGGTEADNLAIRGVIAAAASARPRLVVSAIEHPAVLETADALANDHRAEVVHAPVSHEGIVDVDALAECLSTTTMLVSIMHGNNETGALQPVRRIAELCRERGALYHCDTIQSVGKVAVDVKQLDVDLCAISGHKIFAPKGVGACYVRTRIRLAPQSTGGGQERERRAGTENVAGIVALGKACELARLELEAGAAQLERLRDRLERQIAARISGIQFNGSSTSRLPHILNIGFDNAEAESLILGLDLEGVAVSSGSACSAGSLDPSHVLLAMGQTHERASSAIRFSLGRTTTELEIDRTVDILAEVVRRVRLSA